MSINHNFQFLLNNTSLTYPIPLTEEDALKYLNIIYDKDFRYNNINNYDIIDYEKIIYIETFYFDNQQIQKIVQEIKKAITQGYIIKNQYQNRIIDFPNYIEDKEKDNQVGYYGIPKKFR